MSDQIQDVWQSLREKRLWPIALVLVLAIVAVPVLLTKSAAQPPAGDPLATVPVNEDRVTVELDDGDAASTGAGSALDHFAEGDPFTPPGAIAKGATASADSAAAGPSAAAGGGDGQQVGGGSPPSSTSPGAPIDVAPPVTRTETAEYEYVADVTFWNGDRRREIRGLRKLDMLPSQSAPVLIFMGTSAEGGNAVFLVDSTLDTAGEGHCVPGPENCAYVHVGPGSEHTFTTEEADSYRLRVDEIRRVKVRAGAARAASPSARASVGDGPAVRRFELPSLIDLVAVTETATTPAPAPDPAPAEKRSSVAAGGR
ncbi:MAG TPA: hypothetical protein VNO82_22455 [Solirubrobacteraceae bacterium]|nr:hypothetical protein [Solirubrobacteraceae bacterium]